MAAFFTEEHVHRDEVACTRAGVAADCEVGAEVETLGRHNPQVFDVALNIAVVASIERLAVRVENTVVRQ